AGVVRAAEAGEPGGAAAQDGRDDRDGLDVVDRGRPAVHADRGRKRRLEARLAHLAFEALEQRGLLAADVGAGTPVQTDLEVVARAAGVAADQARVVRLVDRRLQDLRLAHVFAADVDVAVGRAHADAGEQAALDQLVRIVAHDLPVLAGAGLALVGVDHEVDRAAVGLLGHERHLEPGREAGAAAPAQPRLLDLLDDPVAALGDQLLGAVPVAAPARAVEAPVVLAEQVGEDAVLVSEHRDPSVPPGSSRRSRGPAGPSPRPSPPALSPPPPAWPFRPAPRRAPPARASSIFRRGGPRTEWSCRPRPSTPDARSASPGGAARRALRPRSPPSRCRSPGPRSSRRRSTSSARWRRRPGTRTRAGRSACPGSTGRPRCRARRGMRAAPRPSRTASTAWWCTPGSAPGRPARC